MKYIFILNTLLAHSMVFKIIKQKYTHASELFHDKPILPNFYSPHLNDTRVNFIKSTTSSRITMTAKPTRISLSV
jgi:hypothetical protein